jgi:arginine/lysine/ornithine decarboxylase
MTTNPNLAPRLKKEQSYTLLRLWAFMECYTANLTFAHLPVNEISEKKTVFTVQQCKITLSDSFFSDGQTWHGNTNTAHT